MEHLLKENIKKLVQDFYQLIYLHLEELLKLPISDQILPLKEVNYVILFNEFI